MIKVMVVDDELPIREWLVYVIDQISDHVQLVASAADGAEGFTLFCKYRPDIVVTDIKMPNADGMKLLKEIRGVDKDTYVVILTSYQDFEYARTALKYNANDFLLKNEITQDSIKLLIRNYCKLKEKTPTKQCKCKVIDALKNPNLLPELFSSEQQKTIGILYANENFEKEVFSFNGQKGILEIHQYQYDAHKKLLLLKVDESCSTSQGFNQALKIAEQISSVFNIGVGISDLVDNVRLAIEHAKAAWDLTFYSFENEVKNFSEGCTDVDKTLQTLRSQVIDRYYKNSVDLRTEILHFLLIAQAGKYSAIDKLKNYVIDVLNVHKLSCIKYYAKEYEQKCNQIIWEIRESENINVMKKNITHYFDLSQEYNGIETDSQYVRMVYKYVQENYKNIDSLSEVADYLHLSKDYFCRMFKEKEGKTFISYLTEYRIDKAKELLVKTNMKVNEVAEAVGYSSLSYFSSVFKKRTGKNPFEYRGK